MYSKGIDGYYIQNLIIVLDIYHEFGNLDPQGWVLAPPINN